MFALNNLQRLICHKTQTTKPNQTWVIQSQRTLYGSYYTVHFLGEIPVCFYTICTISMSFGRIPICCTISSGSLFLSRHGYYCIIFRLTPPLSRAPPFLFPSFLPTPPPYSSSSSLIYSNNEFSSSVTPCNARGVMVIVVGIRHDDTSSNPRRD